jgi:hypothetical protein
MIVAINVNDEGPVASAAVGYVSLVVS